jgi:hypothetical protein
MDLSKDRLRYDDDDDDDDIMQAARRLNFQLHISFTAILCTTGAKNVEFFKKIVNIPTGYAHYNMRVLKQQLQAFKTEVEALTKNVASFSVLTPVLPSRSVCQEEIVQDEQNFVNRNNLFVTVFMQVTFNTPKTSAY